MASATVTLWLHRRRSDGADLRLNDDRPELFAEIGAEAKRVLAIARRLFTPRGRIVRRKEPTLENRGRRAMKSDVEEYPRRCYHGTVHLSDKAWLIGFKTVTPQTSDALRKSGA
jgi:hypothetical protein